jgi:hypothetical protein
MVTAELAVGLPALAVVVGFAFAGLAALTAQIRCADAAAISARLAGRGESAAVVRTAALDAAPPGATLRVSSGSATVTTQVSVRLAGPGFLHRLGFTVMERSVAPLEPGQATVPGQR